MPVVLGVVLGVAWPAWARAEDECSSDEECVELYTEGFWCAEGSLGRYCMEPACEGPECYGDNGWMVPCGPGGCGTGECTDDAECAEGYGAGWGCRLDGSGWGQCVLHECDTDADCADRGPDWICSDWGGGTHCEEDPEWVPPFRSCAAMPGAPSGLAWLTGLGALALLALHRRR